MEDLELADVVTSLKKGKGDDPGNYRHIALLQALYKVYANLIKN